MPVTPTMLREARAHGGAVLEAVDATQGRYLIQIISPGMGSSGFYPREALQQAATARIWPKGCHMYLDHPTESEERDRPERTLRDLAAVLDEDARWDESRQALVAEARVYSDFREALTERAADIGVSIRATAIVEYGDVDGRNVPIITEFTEGLSVDFVTAAGRGGKILQVIESARATRLGETTANDTRDALNRALTDEFGDDKSWLYVQDYDQTTVWYQHGTPEGYGTYALGYSIDDNAVVAFSGAPVEVRAETTYVPVDPAGQSTPQESEEDTMPQIEESRLAQLEADAGRVQTLEAERAATTARVTEAEERAATAERALAEATARTTATTHARARVLEANATLPTATVERIVEAATRTVALTESGQLDTAALNTATDAARTAEESYLAGLAEAAGVGSITGFGGTAAPTELSESDAEARLAKAGGYKIKGA